MSSPTSSGTRLTITNGTFKLSSASALTPYFGSQTICASTGRLWLNNSSGSITVVGVGTGSGAGSPTISGELRIDDGTFGYGSGNNTATFSSGTGVLRMSNGTFNMFGAISFPSSAGTQFIMSGGNINVDPQAGNNLASSTTLFSIGTSTTVNWSGGIITIIDPHNATAGVAWSATSGGSKTITGGTLKLGDGISSSIGGAVANTNGFGFFSSMPVWNLEINSMLAVNSRNVRLSSSTASLVQNTLTINSGGYLFLGSGTTASTLIARGNVVNNGTIAGCEPAGTQSIGTLYFQGQSGAQTLTGAGSITNLATLTLEHYGSGVSSSIVFKVRRVNLFTGTLDPTNITIGNPSALTGENPIAQMGSGITTLATGTFSAAPTYDETEGERALFYSGMLGAPTMGIYNEIGTGSLILTQLLVNDADGLTIPANRTISIGGTLAGTLSMTLGNINLSGGTLTLGNNATTPGTLTWTSGFIVNGTFTRWYPTTGLPTAVSTGIGYYPMASGLDNRQVQLFFSTATALSAGGTITVTPSNVFGFTSITGFVDGGITVDKRSNSNWAISTGNGITLTGTMSAAIRADNVAAITNVADIRMIRATDAVGTSANGSGTPTNPVMNRTAMSLADLGNTFYLGSGTANMNSIFTSVASGNWGDGSTWDAGTVPTSADNAIIAAGHTVTAAGGTPPYVCNNLTINATGALVNTANTINIGPAGGGKSTLTNNGSLTVSGTGILNINGNFINNSSAGNIFTQSGGNINVDGNAAGVAANSVASGTNLVTFSSGTPTTVFFTGGTFTIVDPHASSTSSYALSGGMSTATNCSLSHTFVFGDGISNDPAPGGFLVYLFPGSSYLILGNVIINGTATMDRFVSLTSTVGILGNITINGYGELRTSSVSNYYTGNITVNSNGILTNPNVVNLASYANATVTPATVPQTISGAGYFRNLLPTASVSAGGTGYVVGDILTVVGGTFTSVAKFVVSAVSSGAVSTVTAIGYANYSVAPTTPAATTGGTGTGCTLTTLTNLTPTASMNALAVNNSNATGVTIGTPLSISGTLTLTLGVTNTTATNLLTLGTATLAGTLSGGSATAYIIGPFARTFAASRTASGTFTTSTLFPVGKGTTYLPVWIDPSTSSVGPVVFKGEAFTSNPGSAGSGVTGLSTNRWETLISSGSGNFLNSYLMIGDAGIVSGNQILQANAAAGVYGAISVASVFTAGTPNTLKTGSAILAASFNGYFAYGTLTPCTVPGAQPTGFITTFKTTTGFTGSFAPPFPPPSNYLVVRYASGATATPPVDYTAYTVGGSLGTGTVRSISTANNFIETGLSAGTTYDYYTYSYNNSGCYGPVYLTSSPLFASVTTCSSEVGVPGTPTSSAVTTSSFTATWGASTTLGVNYLLDVSTVSTFTSFVSGYAGKDVAPISVKILPVCQLPQLIM